MVFKITTMSRICLSLANVCVLINSEGVCAGCLFVFTRVALAIIVSNIARNFSNCVFPSRDVKINYIKSEETILYLLLLFPHYIVALGLTVCIFKVPKRNFVFTFIHFSSKLSLIRSKLSLQIEKNKWKEEKI